MELKTKIKYGDFSADDLDKCINPRCNNLPVASQVLCKACVNKDIFTKIKYLNKFEENRLGLNNLLKIEEIKVLLLKNNKYFNEEELNKESEKIFSEYNERKNSNRIPTGLNIKFNNKLSLKVKCMRCKHIWSTASMPKSCPECGGKRDTIENVPVPIKFKDRIAFMLGLTTIDKLKKDYIEGKKGK